MFKIKVPANSAVVRSGWGGLKIVTGRSASVTCLPWVHKHAIVTFAAKNLELDLSEGYSAITRDQLSVTCQAQVSLKSLRDKDSILAQLRSGASDQKASKILDDTLRRKCMSGIREMIAGKDYADLQGGWMIDDPEQLARLAAKIEPQGFGIELLQIVNVALISVKNADAGDILALHVQQLQNEMEQKERIESNAADTVAANAQAEQRTKELISEGEKEAQSMMEAITQQSTEMKAQIANENKPEMLQGSDDSDLGLDALKEEMASQSQNEQVSSENLLSQREVVTTEQGEKAKAAMLEAYQESDQTEQWQGAQDGDIESMERQAAQVSDAQVAAQRDKIAVQEKMQREALNSELEGVQSEGLAAQNAQQQAISKRNQVGSETSNETEGDTDG